ncbi:hypothetical protein BJ166DRAFT_619341 [Pestalotiopsis sp. NC0098]|nr:hypothetical protein BJ166DRAFT_619341 [Pestalotiopsis sp. NC0098]
MANQLVSDEWVHPAERGTEKTYTQESALEYLTPLMTKYAYERYRYNLTPREVYEILFEGCWQSVDDFVQYMQNAPPAPESVRLYTFEELDAMDAGEWTEDAPEEVSEYDDENNDNYEDDFDVGFDAEFDVQYAEDFDVEVEEDVQMEEELEEEESDDELMPFDPLPLYESQCADDETIIERGRAPSFFQPSTPPPEYRTQPSTPVTAEEVVLPEDSDDESDEEQLVPESLDDNKVSSLPSPTEEALTEDSDDESQDESDEEVVSESQDDDEDVILSSPTEDSEEAKLRADFKRRIEQGWQLDMSVWYSDDLANKDPEKKTDSQEQPAVEETTSTEVIGGEHSSSSSEDTQESAVTPEVQVKADKQKTPQDTVAWAATTARFPANVNASAPDWVDRRAADRIAAAQIAADRVAEGSRRWADRFKKDTVPAEKLVEERSSEAESESSITQSPPRPAPASVKKSTIVEKAVDTAFWTQDKVVKSRRLVTSTVVKVVPAALVLAGTPL